MSDHLRCLVTSLLCPSENMASELAALLGENDGESSVSPRMSLRVLVVNHDYHAAEETENETENAENAAASVILFCSPAIDRSFIITCVASASADETISSGRSSAYCYLSFCEPM